MNKDINVGDLFIIYQDVYHIDIHSVLYLTDRNGDIFQASVYIAPLKDFFYLAYHYYYLKDISNGEHICHKPVKI